jgi:hypothetical protein
LIDQEEPPAAGRVAAPEWRGRFEAGPRVDDLDANPVGVPPKADLEDELRHEE